MGGCFGNHPVDRYLENQLNRHLDEEEEAIQRCEKCVHCDAINDVNSKEYKEYCMICEKGVDKYEEKP